MKRREVAELIEGGEGLRVEFKKRFSTFEKIAREIIALANTRGGYIFFGVNDDGTVCGVESEKGEAELIKRALNEYCLPVPDTKLHFFEFDGYEIVILEIMESDVKPHRLQDYLPDFDISNAIVCVRINDKSVQVSKEMIKILQAESSGKRLYKYEIGKTEKKVFEFLEQNETITSKELEQAANISSRRAARTLIKLVRAGLIFIHTKDNGENFYTNAG